MFYVSMNPNAAATEESNLYAKTEAAGKLKHYQLFDIASFLNSDPDFWVFRRFGRLHMFNILTLQNKLSNLEAELLLQIPKQRTAGKQDGNFDLLVSDIQRTLKEYDDALSAQARFKSYRKPEKHALKHLEKSSNDHNGGAVRFELDIHQEGGKDLQDLASIAAIEKTWTHRFIDRHQFLCEIFKDKIPTENLYSGTLIYSEENVQRAETAFLHVSFCILLLCPISMLSYFENKVLKLGILAISLFVVSLLSVGFLNTPNKTGLALVAGYAAILVVFLSSNAGS